MTRPMLQAAAFGAVYLIWGSTYLFIRFAVAELPPFLTGAVRFLAAGTILLAWARLRGDVMPTRAQGRTAAIGGFFLLTAGNGAVVWAVQRVPSGIAAIIVATLPVWMVLIEWARPGGWRPRLPVFGGIALGLGGIALLLDPRSFGAGAPVDPVGALVLCSGSIAWAAGSIFMRNAPMPSSTHCSTAWASAMAPKIMGAPDRPALGEEDADFIGRNVAKARLALGDDAAFREDGPTGLRYTVDLTADFDRKAFHGKATLDIVARADAQEIVLDSKGLEIESIVNGEGKPLDWAMGKADEKLGAPLTVKLDGQVETDPELFEHVRGAGRGGRGPAAVLDDARTRSRCDDRGHGRDVHGVGPDATGADELTLLAAALDGRTIPAGDFAAAGNTMR